MVLIPAECGEEEFRKAWGKDVRCVELKNWSSPGLLSLSNKPSQSNEVLQLRDALLNCEDAGHWTRRLAERWWQSNNETSKAIAEPSTMAAGRSATAGKV